MIIAASYAGQLVGAIFLVHWQKNRAAGCTEDHHHYVCRHECGMFICLEWMVPADYSLPAGIGIGAEVPVASAYINEFIGSQKRGRFFLLYEVIFPVGLMFAGIIGYFLVPLYGWKAMFWVGLIPPMIAAPLRWLMPESPAGLLGKGVLRKLH
jgi:putative MFS transporter